MENVVYSFDLGASKLRLVVAEPALGKPFDMNILAAEESSFKGMKRGQVFDMDKVSFEISNIISRVDKTVKKKCGSAKQHFCINIGARLYKLEYKNKSYEVGQKPVTEQMLHKFQEDIKGTLSDDSNSVILDSYPVSYSFDNAPEIESPIGCAGKELHIKSIIISTTKSIVNSYNSLFENTNNFDLLLPTASSKLNVLLSPQQKKATFALVDFGAGIISVAVSKNGKVINDTTIPLGSSLVTDDIASGLEITQEEAEFVKCNLNRVLTRKERYLEIRMKGKEEGFNVDVKKLNFIVQARINELVAYINSALSKSYVLNDLEAVYLVGDGSKLYGFKEALAKNLSSLEKLNNRVVLLKEGDYSDPVIFNYAGAVGVASAYIERKLSFWTPQIQFSEVEDKVEEKVKEEQPPKETNPKDKKKPKEKKKGFISTFIDKASEAFFSQEDGDDI